MNITFSQSLTERINGVSLQPGASFMNGSAYTTAFASGIMGIGMNTVSLAGNIIEIAPLVAEITTSCVNEVTNELISYTTNAITKIVALPFATMSELIASYTVALTYKPQDILKNLTSGWDNVISSAVEEGQAAAIAKMTEIVNEKAGEATNKVKKVIEDINHGIKTVSTYVAQGPEWLSKTLSAYCYTAISATEKEIGRIVYDVENAKYKWIDRMAYFVAAKVVKPLNSLTEKTLKRTYELIDEVKQSVAAVARAIVQAAIMAIIGLLGA